MASIKPVTTNDPQAIAKVNAAIIEANKVDRKAEQSDLNNEIKSREMNELAEEQARMKADTERPKFAQVSPIIRPGDGPSYFTASIFGRPDDLTPIPVELAKMSPDGMVVAIEGAGRIARVSPWRLEPARVVNLRFVVRRTVDTEDPANDAVQLGVAWMRPDFSEIGIVELANLIDISVGDGRLEYNFRASMVIAEDVDVAPPSGAVYFRPFVRSFGSGVTHVEVIEVTDATNSVAWSPNVDLMRREIAGLSAQLQFALDRLEALEATA